MDVAIREERPTDLLAVHCLNAAAFPTDAEARLVDALRAHGRLTLSLVAALATRSVISGFLRPRLRWRHLAAARMKIHGPNKIPGGGTWNSFDARCWLDAFFQGSGSSG